MAGKTSLQFILNPTATEPQIAGLLELHKAAFAHGLLLPSIRSPPRSVVSSAGLHDPVRAEEKRFVAIRPKAQALSPMSIAVLTDGESNADEEDDDHDHSHDEAHAHSEAAEATEVKPKRKKVSKKKTRMCKEDGCTSLAVSRRSCVRHGGGSRCVVDGCENGAKLRNRCFQHGGSTICLADGCESKAKRYGYCWSHGGGRICSDESCDKVAAQGGLCWAHGGGNRCKLDGCTKRSYQKHGYYCKRHALYNVTP